MTTRSEEQKTIDRCLINPMGVKGKKHSVATSWILGEAVTAGEELEAPNILIVPKGSQIRDIKLLLSAANANTKVQARTVKDNKKGNWTDIGASLATANGNSYVAVGGGSRKYLSAGKAGVGDKRMLNDSIDDQLELRAVVGTAVGGASIADPFIATLEVEFVNM